MIKSYAVWNDIQSKTEDLGVHLILGILLDVREALVYDAIL